MFTKVASEKPTTELFVQSVVDKVGCNKHDADKGFACWGIETSSGLGLGAVCNRRAKRAGFNHKISEASLRLHRKKK